MLVALALTAGCRTNRPLGEAALASRMITLAGAGDSVALARLALRQCGTGTTDDRQRCYEGFFVALSDSGRVRLALGTLAALARVDPQVEGDGHVYTHLIGIRSWQPGQDIGATFARCTGLFQSGCYHGVIQAYLTAEGDADSVRVAGLCDAVEGSSGNAWLRFQCVHGVGHGLEMIWNWNLPEALAGCDWLGSDWDREGCYGGAFMENAVASIPGGHHAVAQVIASEHQGHMGHDAPPPFPMRDSADALYPCSIVGERYQSSCYMLQGGIILQRVGMDFARAAAECDRAPSRVRHNCYLSLGTSASGITVRDSRRAIADCAHGDPGYQPWCYVGVVKNFIDVTARPADGIAFCRQVPAGRNRRQCWVAVGEQIRVLHAADRGAQAQACAGAPMEGREACRYGAGLLAAPPPGYPIRPGRLE
ncbi:MAG: hypothetical protein OEW44_03910 [Gemmatimonadota bacterium]|jgi:hypothetical protein|nr:hypothetical protein [Gemmatimonadota bacterium]